MSNGLGGDIPSRGNESNAGLIWDRHFLECCGADRAANVGWGRLDGAGLGGGCRRLLWEYANGEKYFTEMQRGDQFDYCNVKAYVRASRVEQSH